MKRMIALALGLTVLACGKDDKKDKDNVVRQEGQQVVTANQTPGNQPVTPAPGSGDQWTPISSPNDLLVGLYTQVDDTKSKLRIDESHIVATNIVIASPLANGEWVEPQFPHQLQYDESNDVWKTTGYYNGNNSTSSVNNVELRLRLYSNGQLIDATLAFDGVNGNNPQQPIDGQQGQPGQPIDGQQGQPGQPVQPGQPGQPVQPGQPGQPVQPGQPGGPVGPGPGQLPGPGPGQQIPGQPVGPIPGQQGPIGQPGLGAGGYYGNGNGGYYPPSNGGGYNGGGYNGGDYNGGGYNDPNYYNNGNGSYYSGNGAYPGAANPGVGGVQPGVGNVPANNGGVQGGVQPGVGNVPANNGGVTNGGVTQPPVTGTTTGTMTPGSYQLRFQKVGTTAPATGAPQGPATGAPQGPQTGAPVAPGSTHAY